MTAGTIRADCACGAWVVCHAARPFPSACGFCGRSLPAPTVATRLRALRAARGLTAAMLAARLGVGHGTLWGYEFGHRPISAARLHALAEVLDVDPSLLAARAPEPSKELHMDDLDQSCPTAPEPASRGVSRVGVLAGAEPAAPRRRVVERVTAELACLLCGRPQGIVEVGQPAPRPRRCTTCGGSIVVAEVTRRRVRLETVDWSAERPRRGRPPKSLATRCLATEAA
jgi:transcriptional regulator with XRE-family HTH domain